MNINFTKPEVIASFIAAIVSLINIVTTIFYNRKQIKANVVSKSRIEWIQNVRKELIKLINSFYQLKNYDLSQDIKKRNKNNQNNQKYDSDLLKLNNNLRLQIETFKTYFPVENNNKIKNKSFEKLFYNINNESIQDYEQETIENLKRLDNEGKNKYIRSFISDLFYIFILRNKKIASIYSDELLTTFIDSISLYLKIEWERAKKNN